MHRIGSLCYALRELGVRGQAVVVHSALRALGPVHGGADTVISALLECVGDPWLEKVGGLRRGRLADAECLLLDAGIFQEQVIARLVDNPLFLLV